MDLQLTPSLDNIQASLRRWSCFLPSRETDGEETTGHYTALYIIHNTRHSSLHNTRQRKRMQCSITPKFPHWPPRAEGSDPPHRFTQQTHRFSSNLLITWDICSCTVTFCIYSQHDCSAICNMHIVECTVFLNFGAMGGWVGRCPSFRMENKVHTLNNLLTSFGVTSVQLFSKGCLCLLAN